jgi:hypothetical protein
VRRAFVLAPLLLLLARQARPEGGPPPAELLENLDFFKDFTETSADGLWEDFDVVASTAPFATEEVVKP